MPNPPDLSGLSDLSHVSDPLRWVREDVRSVPHLDDRVAGRCPVRAQLDAAPPSVPSAASPAGLRRLERVRERREQVLAELAAATGALVLDDAPTDRTRVEVATTQALADGVPVVVHPALPQDHAGRRRGAPDALLAAPSGGYHPLLVRAHRTVSTNGRDLPARFATLSSPALDAAAPHEERRARRRRDDQLALAHHHRLLEAAGHAAPAAWGAVVGVEHEVVWTDLTAPTWRTPSRSRGYASRSALEVYDFEFGFRLDVVAAAGRGEERVVPVRTRECGECPWWGHCGAVLEAQDHVSLLPGATWNRWVVHRDRGVRTVADLARRRHDDPAYDGTRVDIAASVDLARARLAASPVVRRRGTGRLAVPRAQVEVDIDLENVESGVYLWGALVTDRTGGAAPVEEGYRSFTTWDPEPGRHEVAVAEAFADWLDGVRAAVHGAGLTLAVYCFNEKAEAGALRRLATLPGAAPGRATWVEELVGSSEWVDLYLLARDHLLTGTSMGLKYLARAAGFDWEDDDPGGEQSMEWHRLAVGATEAPVRAANRHRILTYNRNDTEATLALREWLDRHGQDLPSAADLGPTGELIVRSDNMTG